MKFCLWPAFMRFYTFVCFINRGTDFFLKNVDCVTFILAFIMKTCIYIYIHL